MEIRKLKLRRIGHTLRKDDEQPSGSPKGKRARGKPRNSWKGSTLRYYLAADRDKWKKLVGDLCS
jgi:hypothetical protein